MGTERWAVCGAGAFRRGLGSRALGASRLVWRCLMLDWLNWIDTYSSEFFFVSFWKWWINETRYMILLGTPWGR
jgi:hypothetical protein